MLWTAVLSGALGGAVLFVFLQWLTVGTPSKGHDEELGLLIDGAYAVVAAALMFGLVPGRFERSVAWLAARRPPTPVERAATLAAPARLAAYLFRYWAGAAVLFGVLNATLFHSSIARAVQVAGTTLLGGLTTCLAFFLVIERRLRPVFAAALSEAPLQRPATIGIRPRIVLSWALGSGVALVSLVLLPATVGTNHGHLVASTVFLAITGLVAGFVLALMAALSVADPIEEVRACLRRVQAGDLDVSLPVDDGGEIGLLKAGVNEMVAGLRERVLFRDLLGRHVGDEVARFAVERGAGLSGEVREVSALFVDVVGSTALARRRPATEVVTGLNELFRLVDGAARAEGGWINKFEGDAALCVFGAPDDQPDHAARALRAARRLGDELRSWATTGGLDSGVGVSSGSVVAGNIGSERRYEYTVIGDPVNEAARLSDLAKGRPERVVASGTIVGASGAGGGRWVPIGQATLRGRDHPSELFVPD